MEVEQILQFLIGKSKKQSGHKCKGFKSECQNWKKARAFEWLKHTCSMSQQGSLPQCCRKFYPNYMVEVACIAFNLGHTSFQKYCSGEERRKFDPIKTWLQKKFCRATDPPRCRKCKENMTKVECDSLVVWQCQRCKRRYSRLIDQDIQKHDLRKEIPGCRVHFGSPCEWLWFCSKHPADKNAKLDSCNPQCDNMQAYQVLTCRECHSKLHGDVLVDKPTWFKAFASQTGVCLLCSISSNLICTKFPSSSCYGTHM